MARQQISSRDRNMIYLMLIGCFLGGINQTILSPALPSIMQDLHIDAADGQWLTTIFLLINGIMIPCSAYLMARFTTRQLYLLAMTIFGLGTLCAGLSHSFVLLLVARVLQALGFGILMPLLSATVLMVYPPSQRGKAMGMVGMVFSVAPAIGPSIAGFVVDNYGWNTVFLGLVPFIVLDIILCAVVMPHIGETGHVPLDKTSVLLSTLGFGGLLYGFSSVGSYGWLSAHVYVPLILGAVIIYIFVKRQSKLEEPLLRFDCFQSHNFTAGLIIGMIINAALLVGGILTPIYLQDVHGYSALVSALVMMPAALIAAAINPVVGSVFDRIGGRPVILFGLTMLTIGSFLYATFTEESGLLYIALVYTVRICGINLVMMPVNTWSMAAFRGESVPHANAVFNTLRQIAGSVGTAIFVSIYMMVQTMAAGGDAVTKADSLFGLRVSFAASAMFMLFALILAFFTVKDGKKKIKTISPAK